MKSLNRALTICTILFVSFTLFSSLFFLLNTDVQAKDRLAVNVSDPIITNTTWTAANSPYILTGNVTVNEGITLTIEPGVTVMGGEGTALLVNGRLEAIGTPSQPITFTSVDNSAPGQWGGLYIGIEDDTGSAHLNHVVVQYGVSNINIDPLDGAPTTKIENTITQFSQNYGMVIGNWSLHLAELENVTFANNGKNRISVEIVENPPITDNLTLTAQPGLEGYELRRYYSSDSVIFDIPSGVTLTVEPDVTIFTNGGIQVNGRLEAIGTPTQPITFTSVLNSAPGEWGGISIVKTGSAHLNYSNIQYGKWNINIDSFGEAPITEIENTRTEFSESSGMSISGYALHLVDLDNVTFANNGKNRIDIWGDESGTALVDDVTLSSQPGLEGYEVAFDHYGNHFSIPSGITLTMEPNVTLFLDGFTVLGHLEAIGTPSQPITFTSIANSSPGGWGGIAIDKTGSAHLNHTVVQYGYANIMISSEDGAPITKIENTVTQFSQSSGMSINDYALHFVDLDNVTFANNGKNRIDIWGDAFVAELVDDVMLSSQPGLEGYEVRFEDNSGYFSIPSGITLTMEPNVSMFMPSGFILVNGRLRAIGTPTQPITFSSIATDTYPWNGILLDGGSTELAHTTINHSQQNGLTILDGSVFASCSTFTNNLNSGIVVDENAQASVALFNNSLAGNTVAGLRHEGSSYIDARYTWWGSTDGPSGNGAGSGDAVTGNVLYEPWLTEPACHDVEFVNLEVTQIASSAVITPAETLTYTITVTNHAAPTATQVVLTDTLPANVTLLAAPAYCSGSTELVCTLADLVDGEQTSFTIQVQAHLTETAVLTNTIDVLAAQPDLNPNFNHSVLTTVVQPEAPKWQIFLPMVIKPN